MVLIGLKMVTIKVLVVLLIIFVIGMVMVNMIVIRGKKPVPEAFTKREPYREMFQRSYVDGNFTIVPYANYLWMKLKGLRPKVRNNLIIHKMHDKFEMEENAVNIVSISWIKSDIIDCLTAIHQKHPEYFQDNVILHIVLFRKEMETPSNDYLDRISHKHVNADNFR